MNPDEFGYSKGARIFEPKRSSVARYAFKAGRTEARRANRPAVIAARIAEAAQKANA